MPRDSTIPDNLINIISLNIQFIEYSNYRSFKQKKNINPCKILTKRTIQTKVPSLQHTKRCHSTYAPHEMQWLKQKEEQENPSLHSHWKAYLQQKLCSYYKVNPH